MSLQIPILSFAEIKKGTALPQLAEAVTQKGVFYLTDTGLVDDDHTSARETCVDFLVNGSEEEKKAVTLMNKPNIRRGFSGLEWESTALITEKKNYTDYSCCFSMGPDGNMFPNEAFKGIWQPYFDRLYTTSKEVALSVLEAVGAKVPDEGLAAFGECDPLLRLRYFPEVPEDRVAETQPLRMGPHYDLSILTLIHQTACANGFISLQAEVDGEFVDLPTVPGAMLVFCGAVGTVATDGKVKAPKHRVKAPNAAQRVGSSRTSSVFFLRPSPDFRFNVAQARKCGLDVHIPAEHATFQEWMGFNYSSIRTDAVAGEVRS